MKGILIALLSECVYVLFYNIGLRKLAKINKVASFQI